MNASTATDRVAPVENNRITPGKSQPKSAWDPRSLLAVKESPPILRNSIVDGRLSSSDKLENWFSSHEELDTWMIRYIGETYSMLRKGEAWFFLVSSAWWHVEEPSDEKSFPLYENEIIPFEVDLREAITVILRRWEEEIK